MQKRVNCLLSIFIQCVYTHTHKHLKTYKVFRGCAVRNVCKSGSEEKGKTSHFSCLQSAALVEVAASNGTLWRHLIAFREAFVSDTGHRSQRSKKKKHKCLHHVGTANYLEGKCISPVFDLNSNSISTHNGLPNGGKESLWLQTRAPY